MRLFVVMLGVLGALSCSGGGAHVSSRRLLSDGMKSFLAQTKASSTSKVWLTNQYDSECDRSDNAERERRRYNDEDTLAYEVFLNHLVASQWGQVIESHRHNYAKELKVDTHKLVMLGGKTETVMPVEDLCFLDEAKKRNADKVLVYELLALSSRGAMIHFRLSDARTGLVEVSKTLQVSERDVVDRSL